MHVPSPSSRYSVVPTPPAIVVHASKEDLVDDAFKADKPFVEVGQERAKDPDLHDVLEAATDMDADERNRPAEVRRAARARGKRGQ